MKPQLLQEVKQKIHDDFCNLNGSKISIIEVSHRSKEYDKIHNNAKKQIRDFLQIPSNFDILWFQGERQLQYAAICLNLLDEKRKCSYIISGPQSLKAYEESLKLANSQVAFSIYNNKTGPISRKCPFSGAQIPNIDNMGANSQNSQKNQTSVESTLNTDLSTTQKNINSIIQDPSQINYSKDDSFVFYTDEDDHTGTKIGSLPQS